MGTGSEPSSHSGGVASTRTRPMVTFSLREKGGGDWQQKGTGSFLRMMSLTCQLQRQAKTCLSPFDVHQNEKTPLRDHECPYDFLVFRQGFKYSFDHKSIRYISLHPVNCPNRKPEKRVTIVGACPHYFSALGNPHFSKWHRKSFATSHLRAGSVRVPKITGTGTLKTRSQSPLF